MEKLKLGLLFGGESPEHEVSLQSAKNIFHALDKEKYDITLIGIASDGKWYIQEADIFAKDEIAIDTKQESVVFIPGEQGVLQHVENASKKVKLDLVFPILHGPCGEDGTIQGLLELAHIPFVGAGVLGSAVAMDKDIMKRLLRDAGLPIAKYQVLRSYEAIPSFEEMTKKLGASIFVKPANMGSSVGVRKVENEKEYDDALKEAFCYDSKILLEEHIVGREIECAVLGNEDPQASLPGEVLSEGKFYSYEAKYINSVHTQIPANLSSESISKIQNLAIKTFQVLECRGLGRVDFFLKKNGELIINEINTLPGFTKISMYPQLWEASGLAYSDLLDRLIEFGLKDKNDIEF